MLTQYVARITSYTKNSITHENSLFWRYAVKHFKTNIHNIPRPSIKNFPNSAVDSNNRTMELFLHKGQASKLEKNRFISCTMT